MANAHDSFLIASGWICLRSYKFDPARVAEQVGAPRPTGARDIESKARSRRKFSADERVRNTISGGIAPDYASLVVYSLRKCCSRSWQVEAVQVPRAAVKSV